MSAVEVIKEEWFGGHFVEWRRRRIEKLVSILGRQWFVGKRVLELGCGLGDIGIRIHEMGARVMFCDGRGAYLEEIKRRYVGAEVRLIDNDGEWEVGIEFDLVIHWGLLYHLRNWRRDLEIALRHGKMLCLGTEVVDSDEVMEIGRFEDDYDQSLHGYGVRPSVAAVEGVFGGHKVRRYDDGDLNTEEMTYDWKAGDFRNEWAHGHRRFWFVEKA